MRCFVMVNIIEKAHMIYGLSNLHVFYDLTEKNGKQFYMQGVQALHLLDQPMLLGDHFSSILPTKFLHLLCMIVLKILEFMDLLVKLYQEEVIVRTVSVELFLVFITVLTFLIYSNLSS